MLEGILTMHRNRQSAHLGARARASLEISLLNTRSIISKTRHEITSLWCSSFYLGHRVDVPPFAFCAGEIRKGCIRSRSKASKNSIIMPVLESSSEHSYREFCSSCNTKFKFWIFLETEKHAERTFCEEHRYNNSVQKKSKTNFLERSSKTNFMEHPGSFCFFSFVLLCCVTPQDSSRFTRVCLRTPNIGHRKLNRKIVQETGGRGIACPAFLCTQEGRRQRAPPDAILLFDGEGGLILGVNNNINIIALGSIATTSDGLKFCSTVRSEPKT